MSNTYGDVSLSGIGLAPIKGEGEVIIYDRSHELSGRKFEAFKDCCQHYSGVATVVRQKKGGMMMCIGEDGTKFEESLRKIKHNLI